VAIYVLVVLVSWKANRRPPFWPWARTFWLTRGVTTYLAPDSADSVDSGPGTDVDGDADELPLGPQPLQSVWAFFRSPSPLDDLLVTFETTRPLVRPLHWTRRRNPSDEESRLGPIGVSTVKTPVEVERSSGILAENEGKSQGPSVRVGV